MKPVASVVSKSRAVAVLSSAFIGAEPETLQRTDALHLPLDADVSE